MPRRPLDTISQERLVAELKVAIDTGNTSRISDLIRENPRSSFSNHVLRDIGKKRADVLRIYAASPRGTSS